MIKIAVLGDDGEVAFDGAPPNLLIVEASDADRVDMGGSGKIVLNQPREPRREIGVKQELHEAAKNISLRSRSAAKARQAWMSSRVR